MDVSCATASSADVRIALKQLRVAIADGHTIATTVHVSERDSAVDVLFLAASVWCDGMHVRGTSVDAAVCAVLRGPDHIAALHHAAQLLDGMGMVRAPCRCCAVQWTPS